MTKLAKLHVKKNLDGDTRTATKVPNITEFSKANNMHREDVKKLMDAIAYEIEMRGDRMKKITSKDKLYEVIK